MMAGMARFEWDDPFLLDEELTDDERMIRDTAHAYAQDKLAPRVVEAFQHEHTDPAIFREMGELGLLGPTVPENMAGSARPTSPMAWSRARWSGSTPATAR